MTSHSNVIHFLLVFFVQPLIWASMNWFAPHSAASWLDLYLAPVLFHNLPAIEIHSSTWLTFPSSRVARSVDSWLLPLHHRSCLVSSTVVEWPSHEESSRWCTLQPCMLNRSMRYEYKEATKKKSAREVAWYTLSSGHESQSSERLTSPMTPSPPPATGFHRQSAGCSSIYQTQRLTWEIDTGDWAR